MKNSPFVTLILLILPTFAFAARSDVKEDEINEGVINMAPFVVYEGLIDVIDGFSEEEYHGGHAVVEGFRESFNKLLLAYHRKLLLDEYQFMVELLKVAPQFQNDLNALAASFGVKRKVYLDIQQAFVREKAITRRLIKDPFFIIDAMVVWDLDQLEPYKNEKLYSKYAKDIRWNEELGKWERRITTHWQVSFIPRNANWSFYTEKFQGLNLDTNCGYHLIENGLPENITSNAFKKVKLTYPIFINSREPVDVQVTQLRETFVSNLFKIYDPYGWMWRRNERMRLGSRFRQPMVDSVKSTRYKVSDPDWFNRVLGTFLVDVITAKYIGFPEIYDLEMLVKVRARINQLGDGLDLLNWHEGEDRSVPYDPTQIGGAWVNYTNKHTARFILLDAYMRHGNKFVIALRDKVAAQKGSKVNRVSGMEMIKEVLEEVTGIPADIYIKKAQKAQVAELNKYKYTLK
ncbi:MAG: hypothetical protein AB3N63_18690 [Puniceicoccaceae bacterium]